MIRLSGITKRFGEFPALHGIDLEIAKGEFVALLGPSGSGKTTLLRIIAGLEFQDSGTVEIGGEDVSDTPVADRGIGFVFQNYALFRHMSVADNVAFGLTVRRRRRGLTRAQITARAEELLRLVRLDGLGKRLPGQLSGGQRQRVALARALAIAPRLLLLDEPFGALDARVRKDLRRALRDLHKEMGLTSVFVTHDQEEALELADRVVVMSAGRIEQVGTPDEVYAHPATPFVSHFVGETNLFGPDEAGLGWRALSQGGGGHGAGDTLHIRPHELAIVATGAVPGAVVPVAAHVANAFRKGSLVRIEARLAISGRLVEIDHDPALPIPAPGETMLIAPLAARSFAERAQ